MSGKSWSERGVSDDAPLFPILPAVHFVGFRDERYQNAVAIWGEPDFIHETWDIYAADDVAECDTVIFATGEWDKPPRSFSKPPRKKLGTATHISR